MDLLLHDAEEAARDRAEGERLAYVAATRARDVLVVPAIGDEVYDGGWLDPLMPAIYPPPAARRSPSAAPGCPAFPSKDTVLTRADGDPARPTTVAPGMFEFGEPSSAFAARRSALEESTGTEAEIEVEQPRVLSFRPKARASALDDASAERRTPNAERYHVVWWDPHSLVLQAPNFGGLRRDDLIAKDGDQAGVDKRMGEYRAWQADRVAAVARAKTPSVVAAHGDGARARWRAAATCRRRTDRRDRSAAAGWRGRSGRGSDRSCMLRWRPSHSTRMRKPCVRIARTQARLLLADDNEVDAAADAVIRALAHPLFERVRAASAAGSLRPRMSAPLAGARRIDRRGNSRCRVRGRRRRVTSWTSRPTASPSELEGPVRAPADALLPRVRRAAKQARAGCLGQDLIELEHLFTRRRSGRRWLAKRFGSSRRRNEAALSGHLDRRSVFFRLNRTAAERVRHQLQELDRQVPARDWLHVAGMKLHLTRIVRRGHLQLHDRIASLDADRVCRTARVTRHRHEPDAHAIDDRGRLALRDGDFLVERSRRSERRGRATRQDERRDEDQPRHRIIIGPARSRTGGSRPDIGTSEGSWHSYPASAPCQVSTVRPASAARRK